MVPAASGSGHDLVTSGIIGVTSGWSSGLVIPLLRRDATSCRSGVGKIEDSNEIGQMNLVLYRNALAASNRGWHRGDTSMVDFCARSR
jgi:hypothetical protein